MDKWSPVSGFNILVGTSKNGGKLYSRVAFRSLEKVMASDE